MQIFWGNNLKVAFGFWLLAFSLWLLAVGGDFTEGNPNFDQFADNKMSSMHYAHFWACSCK